MNRPERADNQHTPGPWKFGHKGDDFWVGPEFDRPLVAEVKWDMGAVENGRENARLIAAAPTMAEYIASCASNGCATAQKIMEQINGHA